MLRSEFDQKMQELADKVNKSNASVGEKFNFIGAQRVFISKVLSLTDDELGSCLTLEDINELIVVEKSQCNCEYCTELKQKLLEKRTVQ